MVDESVVLLRDGAVSISLVVPGISFETADSAELNAQTATREVLLRSALDARFVLYHHVIRRRVHVELEAAFEAARADEAFQQELDRLLREWVGRPTPLSDASRLAKLVGLRRVMLKREDLTHTGAHKINNALGQALLARRMGKRRIVAETGAGQHGVATATACALLGLECDVYMGAEDMRRQALNVFRMNLLGAEVREVTAAGTKVVSPAATAFSD